MLSDEKLPLLLVSHNFPPTVGPESYLVHLNALSLHRAGMGVTVLTTRQEHGHARLRLDETPLKELPADLQVLRTTSHDAWLKARLPRLGGHALQLAEKIFLPETYMLWLPSATRAGLAHLRAHPSLIYSRAQKHVSNVCGWRLKRATGLPWIAHFSDIWVNHYFKSPLTRAFARALEKRILRDADHIVFVTEVAVDHTFAHYPAEWRQRVSIIPHGYAQARPSASLACQGPLKLLHAGAFYPGMRTPETLFEALRILHQESPLTGRLSLTLLGDGGEYRAQSERLGLASVVHFSPPVSHVECQQMIAACDLPVMIDTLGHGGVFLPSKLIEYFAYQKPVLVLTEKQSAVDLLMRGKNMPVADMTAPTEIAATLRTWLTRWESGEWHLDPSTASWISSFQIDQVNQPLVELIQDHWSRYLHSSQRTS